MRWDASFSHLRNVCGTVLLGYCDNRYCYISLIVTVIQWKVRVRFRERILLILRFGPRWSWKYVQNEMCGTHRNLSCGLNSLHSYTGDVHHMFYHVQHAQLHNYPNRHRAFYRHLWRILKFFTHDTCWKSKEINGNEWKSVSLLCTCVDLSDSQTKSQ